MASPTILFLGAISGQDLKMTRTLANQALASGYEKIVEPCCGSFAVSSVSRYAGWPSDRILASDICLFSAICGSAISGLDLAEIDFKLDGEPYRLKGDPLEDAAGMLYLQTLTRAECKKGVWYWDELVKDMSLNRDRYVAKLKESVAKMAKLLGPIHFKPMCLFAQLDAVKDDPRAFILMNPPIITGDYEKLYDTDGRVTWNEPPFLTFDPAKMLKLLAEDSQKWQATFLCRQEDKPGTNIPGTVYGRSIDRERQVSYWSNKPELLTKMLGGQIVAVPLSLKPTRRLKYPTMPYDHEITEKSTISILKLVGDEAEFYKELWIHKIDPVGSPINAAIMIDGMIAGIFGYDIAPINGLKMDVKLNNDCVLMMYDTGCPHKSRLTRLVMMCATTRCVMEQLVNPWVAVQCNGMITAEMTIRAEAKGTRGIMKLVSRSPRPGGRHHVIYRSEMENRTLEETLAQWLAKEREYAKQKVEGPKQGRNAKRKAKLAAQNTPTTESPDEAAG